MPKENFMAIRKIARMGQPILRKVAKAVPVEAITTSPIQSIITDMLDTVLDADGAGLAAPQIYESKRIVLLRFNQNEDLSKIDKLLIQYEAFKKGIEIDNWQINFQKLLEKNDNSFLKIEYINYLLDNNLEHKYNIIDDSKFDKDIMNEYFYYYIYGKYYDKIGKPKLSNFYFCQFYRIIDSKNKADFFCKKYDIKDIPTLDKSYAIFK